MIEVYPSLLCNQMSEHVNLYIKLKLNKGRFFFVNLKVIFQLNFFLLTHLASYSIKK